MRWGIRPALLVGGVMLSALLLTLRPAHPAYDDVLAWVDQCSQHADYCANRIDKLQQGSQRLSLESIRSNCVSNPDDCALRMYEDDHPEALPDPPKDLQLLKTYCGPQFRSNCFIRLYDYERKKKLLHNLSLKNLAVKCENRPDECATRLFEYVRSSPVARGAAISGPASSTAPASAVAGGTPTDASPNAVTGNAPATDAAPNAEAGTAPATDARSNGVAGGGVPPTNAPPNAVAGSTPGSSAAEQAMRDKVRENTTSPRWPRWPLIGVMTIGVAFLLFVLIWFTRAVWHEPRRILSKRISGRDHPSVNTLLLDIEIKSRNQEQEIARLTRQIGELERRDKYIEMRLSNLEQERNFTHTGTKEDVASQIYPIQGRESRDFGLGRGIAGVPAVGRHLFSSATGVRASAAEPDPNVLLEEYDHAIRDGTTAKNFIDKWGVFGLTRVDGQAADGQALLAKANEPDPQHWRFWGITQGRGVAAVFPGRYLYLNASLSSADGGRAGDLVYGPVFKIRFGSGFSVKKFAEARETNGGFEISTKGELELAGSRGPV
jgi:hypothetical protein